MLACSAQVEDELLGERDELAGVFFPSSILLSNILMNKVTQLESFV